MAEEQQSGEKTEDPTPRRRQEARKKGTVAKSTDLVGSITLLIGLMALPYVAGALGKNFPLIMTTSLDRAGREISGGAVTPYLINMLMPALMVLIPFVLLVMTVGVIVNFAQVGFVLSLEPLNPQLQRINPMSGFKRLISRRGAVEGLKATFKLGVFAYIAYSSLNAGWNEIAMLAQVDPTASAKMAGMVLHKMAIKIAVAWLALAVFDYAFQRKETEKQLKMTKYELKREMKEQEGSPEQKMEMMSRRRKASKGGLASKLKLADALITNPTHYAVAISYNRSEMHAPMVVAKGADYLALKMREIAKDVELPIIENPPLARTLHKECEAGDFIPRELFAAVAEVLAYVYKTTKRKAS